MRSFLCVLAFLIFTQVPAFAQSINATLSGRVQDTSSAGVPGAKITLTNIDTLISSSTESNSEGNYVAVNIQPGNYRVEVSKEGFKTSLVSKVVLHVQDAVTLNFDLAVGTVNESVTVSGEAPLVNTSNSSIGGLVDEQRIVELPLNGRNYTDLVFLQPGVAKNTTQSSVSAPGGTIYSSNGAPTRSNNYLLDGAPLQTLQGYSATSVGNTQLGVDGIREYKVVTTNFSADYGMTMGSQMTLISKSGTNQFHGDAFEFLRNAAFDARNYFDFSYLTTGKRVPQYQRNNYGGALGGPIIKNKLFFFGVYEALKERKGVPFISNVLAPGCHGPAGTVLTNAKCSQLQLPASTPSVTISPAAAAFMTLYPSPNLPGTNQFAFTFVQPTDVNYGQLRLDYAISPSDSFFARYTTEKANLNTGSAAGIGTVNLLASWNQYFTLSENHIFSSNVLNSARFSYSRTTQSADFTAPGGQNINFGVGSDGMGNITVPGLSGLGPTGLAPDQYAQNLYSLGDDLFYTRGNHQLKIGFLVNRVEPYMHELWWIRGNAAFGSLSSFMNGTIQSISIEDSKSDTFRYYRWYTMGSYIQDDWRVNSRLSLNLGLRYEFSTDIGEVNGKQYSLRNPATDAVPTQGPEVRNPSFKNFGPRLGFAWDVFGKGSTSIRGGFGLYYDVAQVASGLTQQSTAMPPLSAIYIINNVAATTPLVIPPGTLNNPVELYYYSDQPKLLQWNLSTDQRLPFGMVLNLSYVGTRGYDLYVQSEGNPCVPTVIDQSGPLWSTACGKGRVNPRWGSNTLAGTFSQSWYDGLQVVVNKRLGKGLQFQSSYAYSKALDDGEGQIFQDKTGVLVYEQHAALDKGLATTSLGQMWRFNMLYHLPNITSSAFGSKVLNGWWMGSIVSMQSGFPFSPLTSGSRSQSNVNGNNADRVNLGPTYSHDKVVLGTVSRWYDPTMFALQPLGRLGNAGRDILIGPGFWNWDLAINKDTKLGILGEAGNLQFRAEFFNLANHPNFNLPNATVFNATGAVPATAGQITSTVPGATPRDIQLALKVIF